MIKRFSRKLLALVCVMALSLSMFASTASAAEIDPIGLTSRPSVGTYGPGDWDIGGVTFNDKNPGDPRTYNAHYMQVKPAWKAADSSTSEVEILIKVIREWNQEVAYSHRFKLYEDTDGRKDGDGWWYAESAWFPINYGSDYYIYYEAFTADGYSQTGSFRSANVHMWIELKN